MQLRTTVAGKVVPLCVEVRPRGYVNDKWHHMRRALKLDKKMDKRLKSAVSDVAARCSYFLRMPASARVVSPSDLYLRLLSAVGPQT